MPLRPLNDFRPLGPRRCELGGVAQTVEFFGLGEAEFARLPGGTVTLGFDPKGRFPDAAQKKAWKKSLCWKENKYALDAFLREYLTPARTVTLRPFLVEVKPVEIGRTPADPAIPEVKRMLEGGSRQVWCKAGTFERIGADVFEVKWPTHRALSARAAAEGLRLPTPDEWEYACGAGSRTVFRWGDEVPLDAGPLEPGAFDAHRRPNAFSLEIPWNPFHHEATSAPGVLRGGDGGGMLCGGAGWLPAWLTLATSFAQPGEAKDDEAIVNAHLRRVLSLD